MANKFRVGDIVVPKEGCPYSWVGKGYKWVGEVIELHGNTGFITVKTLTSSEGRDVGSESEALAEYFELDPSRIKLEKNMKVKLKNRRGSYWNREGCMDEYIGQVVEIRSCDNECESFQIFGDKGHSWMFNYGDIENIVYDDYTVKILDSECVKCRIRQPGKESIVMKIPKIYDYEIYNKDTTVVRFADGEKVVVRLEDGTEFDIVSALSMAVMKKVYGNSYLAQIDKVIKEKVRRIDAEEKAKEAAAEEKERVARVREKNRRKRIERIARRELEIEEAKNKLRGLKE